jgi:lipopolysaccharide export system permease protein
LKTLHGYLTRQVVASTLMTAAVFTFVLLVGNVLKEVILLLVHRQATLGVVLEAVGLLIPYVWAFALPMGLLTATLLVFGRFSADHELTAARAGGISLLSLTTPILLLSLFLCGVCALVNMQIAPRCWSAYKNLLSEAKVNIAGVQFPEGRYIKDFDGYIFLIGRNRNQKLQDVGVLISGNGTNDFTIIRASRGQIMKDEVNRKIIVELFETTSLWTVDGHVYPSASSNLTLTLDLSTPRKTRPGLREMTFGQLREEMGDLERRMSLPAALTNSPGDALGGKRGLAEKQRKDITSPVRVEMHQQVAFSFACFGFALVGIPLGIRVHRRETNIGFVIALLLVAVYYAFMLLAKTLSTRAELAPHLIVWLPNFIFQVVGAVLLWRANRGV